MKMNTSKTLMKCVGATLAVCSVMSMVGGAKAGSMNKAKKSVRKTINKMADVVDTIAAVM